MARGTVWYLLSTLAFILGGYGIHIGLGRLLGPTEYGIFGVVISLSSITYIFFNNGIQLAVSKYVSEHGSEADGVLRSAIKTQFIFGLLMTVLWMALAGVIAAVLEDKHLTRYIRVTALAILPLALYEARLGFLNGTRQFGRHALVEVVYSISKVCAVFSFVYLGLRLYGALIGYVVAAVCGFVAVCISSENHRGGNDFPIIKLIGFAVPVMIATLATSLLMNIDVILVKWILKNNDLVGYYTCAVNISKPIWFLSTAIGATLLPFVSLSTSEKDIVATRTYINQALRYGAIILFPLTLVFSADAENVIRLLYSTRFMNGAVSLSVLAFGFLFLSMFTIASTVITASGSPKIAMTIMLSIIFLDIIINCTLIPYYQIIGAAWATTISCFVGMVSTMLYLGRRFQIYLDVLSLFRICISATVTYLIVYSVRCAGFFLLVKYLVAVSAYVGLLLAMREIKYDELAALKLAFTGKVSNA